jgi:hypothetical protein
MNDYIYDEEIEDEFQSDMTYMAASRMYGVRYGVDSVRHPLVCYTGPTTLTPKSIDIITKRYERYFMNNSLNNIPTNIEVNNMDFTSNFNRRLKSVNKVKPWVTPVPKITARNEVKPLNDFGQVILLLLLLFLSFLINGCIFNSEI